MVSSLLHVLIVTPVIFYWLHARRLPDAAEAEAASRPAMKTRRPLAFIALASGVVVIAALSWLLAGRDPGTAPMGQPVQSVTSGEMRVTVLSETGTLRRGRHPFWLEFRDAGGRLVDAGQVQVTGAMPMPGMVMSAGIEIAPSAVKGRYAAMGEFSMAGVWQVAVQWDGPAGRGSATLQGKVQ
jgi:hypothetical protein